jgi:hypothetical protein
MLDDDLFDDIDDFSPSAFAHPPEVEQRIEDTGVAACIEVLLGHLEPREREVIERTFGLRGSEAESIRTMAESWDLSRTRIDQIQKKALRRMRHHMTWADSPVLEYLADAGYPENTPSGRPKPYRPDWTWATPERPKPVEPPRAAPTPTPAPTPAPAQPPPSRTQGMQGPYRAPEVRKGAEFRPPLPVAGRNVPPGWNWALICGDIIELRRGIALLGFIARMAHDPLREWRPFVWIDQAFYTPHQGDTDLESAMTYVTERAHELNGT